MRPEQPRELAALDFLEAHGRHILRRHFGGFSTVRALVRDAAPGFSRMRTLLYVIVALASVLVFWLVRLALIEARGGVRESTR